ncbi:MAG: hypothetical protein ACUZ8H_01380 [Candidatus Anammoxibacter sp.]
MKTNDPNYPQDLNTVDINYQMSGDTTQNFCRWAHPVLIRTDFFDDRVEAIYKETSLLTYTHDFNWMDQEHEVRVFKIVFSCQDMQWHESERIYGEIDPATEESYTFDE